MADDVLDSTVSINGGPKIPLREFKKMAKDLTGADASGPHSASINKDKLRGFLDEFEVVLKKQRDLAEEMSALSEAAKAAHFNPKPLKRIAKQRLETPEQKAARLDDEEDFERYVAALGLGPLFDDE